VYNIRKLKNRPKPDKKAHFLVLRRANAVLLKMNFMGLPCFFMIIDAQLVFPRNAAVHAVD
jgi:hypothetical protein